MKEIRHITLWGDSVMKGVIYDEQKGRYGLLPVSGAEQASEALGLELSNRARMGCTVEKGLAIIRRDLAAGMDCQAAIIEFGGNDCDYDWAAVAENPLADHQPKTPLGVFAASLQEMASLIRQQGITPVMSTLPPIHAERYFAFFTRSGLNKDNILRWLGDIQHIYRWHERYNNTVVQTAQACGCLLIDIRDAFLAQKRYEDYLCADGIHPNQKGHALIEAVLERFGQAFQKKGQLAV